MSYEPTAFLELPKPVKGSGEQFDSDVYSGSLDIIDAKAQNHEERLAELEGTGTGPQLGIVDDLADLLAIDPQPDRGSLFSIRAAAYTGLAHDLLLQRGNSVWNIISPSIVFNTKTNLDTFVTAASAHFRAGQRFWTTTAPGYEWLWNGTAIEPSRIMQSTAAPASPVAGQLWIDTDA